MAHVFKQIGAVTAMNVRTIPQRLGVSLVIVAGVAGVVGVLVAMLAMARGFEATLGSTGRMDRVIVLRVGSLDELGSSMGVEQARLIADVPGIRRGTDGAPLALPEVYALTNVSKKGDPTRAPSNGVVRGTSPSVFKVRPEARIVEGRMFEPGKREAVVGRGAHAEYNDLDIGKAVEVRDGAWTIVGVFESGGDVHESELWVDASALHDAVRAQYYSSLTVQLEDDRPETFAAFKDRLTTDPRLRVAPQREREYYASRSEALETFITVIGYTVAVIMALGAVFGALNTMYAAVATRSVEIATLRAIGFGGGPVVCSIMIEALLLSLVGAVIGATIAYVVFNGYQVSGLNFQTFSQVAFQFAVILDARGHQLVPALLHRGGEPVHHVRCVQHRQNPWVGAWFVGKADSDLGARRLQRGRAHGGKVVFDGLSHAARRRGDETGTVTGGEQRLKHGQIGAAAQLLMRRAQPREQRLRRSPSHPGQRAQQVVQFEQGRDGEPAVQQVIGVHLEADHGVTLRRCT
jgi:putative ABC transport system permease protein